MNLVSSLHLFAERLAHSFAVGLQLHCTQEEVVSGKCLVQNGEELLQLFGWKDLNTGKFVGLLFACAIAWRLLAWVALMIRMRGW